MGWDWLKFKSGLNVLCLNGWLQFFRSRYITETCSKLIFRIMTYWNLMCQRSKIWKENCYVWKLQMPRIQAVLLIVLVLMMMDMDQNMLYLLVVMMDMDLKSSDCDAKAVDISDSTLGICFIVVLWCSQSDLNKL